LAEAAADGAGPAAGMAAGPGKYGIAAIFLFIVCTIYHFLFSC